MREFLRITFVCVCVFVLVRCDDGSSEEAGAKTEEQGERKDGKSLLAGKVLESNQIVFGMDWSGHSSRNRSPLLVWKDDNMDIRLIQRFFSMRCE
ncbi:jg8241 [Pararge aegeria aegeria]|uniref:Jg8241 protein n=1 Tax=Pararge aegeria aegeria TaxID=348720 RepID=A0A8S4RTH2_9NEOP|nr:jg8241 [Pararge aegeria aegeria]